MLRPEVTARGAALLRHDRPHTPVRARTRAGRGAVLGVIAWTAVVVLFHPLLAGAPTTFGYLGAALVGAVAGRLGAFRALWALAAALAVVLVVVTASPIVPALARPLVRRDIPTAGARPDVDAVAVLSGGLGDDGRIQGQAVDRLLDGIALARATGRPLVLSVVRLHDDPTVTSRADQLALVGLAGLADRTAFVDSVWSTHDEAQHMMALARTQGWRRVALVTSPGHSRRACATFERAGLAVTCTPAHARDVSWDGPHPLRSAADRLRVFGTWMYERLAWLEYRARGWV